MEHARKYFKHSHEGDDGISARDTVIRPPSIVQLTYFTVRDTQIAVSQLVLPQEQVSCELDWVARRLHLNIHALHA